MKHFDEDFKTRLWQTIEAIENDSLVEVVVMVKPFSDEYPDIPLLWGAGFAFIALTFFMFTPFIFGDYLLYSGTLGAFALGMALALFVNPLKRLFISKKRMERSVEIMARALFQKGGMHHTQEHIGTLIYCSVFEKSVYILPDRGAKHAVPEDEWQQIREGFRDIFNAPNPADKLLEQLKKCQPVFAEYIPPVENDINELPDDLEVSL
jgi:putative membrane protein